MKKILIFSLTCLTAVPGFSWGLFQDFVSINNGKQSSDYYVHDSLPYQKSPLYAILRQHKNQFTICVIQGIETSPHRGVEGRGETGVRLVKESFSTWLNETRKMIAKAGRDDEFKDLLTWLPNQVEIKVQQPCDQQRPPNITLQPPCLAGHAEWYDKNQHWKLNLADGGDKSLALHELGHFFGLADLGNGSHGTADATYSLSSRSNAHTGVMWWNLDDDVPQSITCDDVEGFINAVDFVQFMEGESSRRLDEGWKSLCGRPYYYLRGRVVRSSEELSKIKDETARFRLQGKGMAKFQALFEEWKAYQDKKVLPLMKSKEEALANMPRPLDTAGLMLSAKVHFLQELNECVTEVLNSISHARNSTQQYGNESFLDPQPWCSPKTEPLSYSRLLKTPPLEDDFPSDYVHKCAFCGQDIAPGTEELRKATYKDPKTKKNVSKTYYKHKDCGALTSRTALLGYRDNPATNRKKAPTYEELQKQTIKKDVRVAIAAQLQERL